MGLKLYPGSIKGQADSIIQNLEFDNKDLLSALQTISQFVQNTELKGAAWDSMKYQLGNHEAVIQGLICANESVIQEHENLKSTVGDENLDEEELIAKRDALISTNTFLEKNISLMQSNMQNDVMKIKYGFWYQEMIFQYQISINQNQTLIEELNEKIQKLYDIENTTASLFSESITLYDTVNEGIVAIQKGWNGTGFSVSLDTPEWKKTVQLRWNDRTKKLEKEMEEYVKKLKKKVPNITLKEWSELYELYQKNPNAEIPADLLKEMLKNIGQIPNEIKDNMQMDIISKVFESGGKSVVKLGEIFLSTGIQGPATENSFVILSNSFAQQSGKLINTGTKLHSFGKVGMPIIGAAIDFSGQLISGEEVGDATVKAAGHLGVGFIAGELGTMAGTAAAATLAVGPIGVAAIGIAAGAAIAVFGSRVFDHAYENNWLGIKDIGKEINEAVDDVKKGLSNVGKAVSGFFDGLGNAFA